MVFDSTSYSNGDVVVVDHISLNWETDFDNFCLVGSATLTLLAKTKTESVVLDTRKLAIGKISLLSDSGENKELEFELKKESEVFGSALDITLPSDALAKEGDTCKIVIEYSTAKGDDCSALQWLTKDQTKDKQHPFLFSQCQAIHARSLVPCMDCPGLKFKYSASVTVPAELTCLMSAVSSGTSENVGDKKKFSFEQKVPISSYLLAICCGFLESRKIGPRSHVWSEPSLVEECAKEFAETEEFLKIGEDLLGSYEWGVYDLLVLPPSFPYGGMENPCLTFVTPTLLAGDKSLVGVVAHEIAHSWTGNLVTNETWDDFWMNEGFTVFVERKIMARALKSDKAGFHLKSVIGYETLEESVSNYGCEHPFTCLHIDHGKDGGVDPDDAFSSVPYEKGFNFLVYLEKLVGGPDVFEPFLKAYIQNFRLTTVTPMKLRSFFEKQMLAAGVPQEKLKEVDWQTWLYSPGLPKYDNEFDTSLLTKSEAVGELWAGLKPALALEINWNSSDINDWTTDMIVLALSKTIKTVEDGSGSPDCSKLDDSYHFSDVINSEVLFKWLTLCIKKKYTKTNPKVVEFITKQGRMKFVRPLYRALYKADGEFRQLAIDTFKEHKSTYHSICQKMVTKDLHL